MRSLRAAFVLFLLLPGTAHAAAASLRAHELSSKSGVVSARFDLIGFHWRGAGDVRFRTRSLEGRWSGWQTAAAEADDLPDRGSAEARGSRGWRIGSPYWVGAADDVQYRTVGRVTQLRVYFVRSASAGRPQRALFLADSPPILTRRAWGADESIRRAAPAYAPTVKFAIVHHTAGSNLYTPSQSAAIVRAIEEYHVRGNGWNDIGYNFLIDRYGQVFEGRYGGVEKPVIGAHALGFNYESVGVALIGDYNGTNITALQRQALVRLLAWRLDVVHVDPLSLVRAISTGNPRYAAGTAVSVRAISGHRDVYPTDCPGNALYASLPAIARAVAATGLPKIYAPSVSGDLGGPVRFTARLSASGPWTVEVTDALGRPVASGAGNGSAVDWTWDATTAAPGSYGYTISAGPDARPATGSLGAPVARLAVTSLAVTPQVVSPNGDGRDDTGRISYQLGAPGTVTVSLADANGTPLATLFTGFHGSGLHTFVWKDIAVPDGRYRIVVSVKNAAGTTASSARPVLVDRTLAAFASSAKAISPNGDGRFDATTFTFTLTAAAEVKLAIRRAGRELTTIFAGHLEAGAQRFSWGGSHLRDGAYTAVVTATDPVAAVTQGVRIVIDTKRPVLRLLSWQRLRFSVNEPAVVSATLDGRQVSVSVGRAGRFTIPHQGLVSQLSAVASDAAGNMSAVVRRG